MWGYNAGKVRRNLGQIVEFTSRRKQRFWNKMLRGAMSRAGAYSRRTLMHNDKPTPATALRLPDAIALRAQIGEADEYDDRLCAALPARKVCSTSRFALPYAFIWCSARKIVLKVAVVAPGKRLFPPDGAEIVFVITPNLYVHLGIKAGDVLRT